ncbi:MAG: GNAT family N-acetyltransferase [Thermoplasmata archaeon]
MQTERLTTQITFIRRRITEVGSRVIPTPWGTFVWNADYPLVHDLANCEWVDRWPSDLSVRDLITDLEKRTRRAGLRHQLLLFAVTSLADQAQDDLIQAGFAHVPGLNLANLKSPRRKPRQEVRVVETTSSEDTAAFWRMAAQELGASESSPEESRQQMSYDRQRYVTLSARLFLATIGNRSVGYAVLIEDRGLGYLFQVYTLPGYRRKGVATTIILRLIEATEEAGNRLTALTVNSSNKPALEMYRQLGFVEVGAKRNFERMV